MLGHPDLGRVILGWLRRDMRSATALRGTCTAARDAVAAYSWDDVKTRVRWPARWRRAFPAATSLSVFGNWWLCDADCLILRRGLLFLDMGDCTQATITDAAFAHLAGIPLLFMRGCYQTTITDAAFAHLRGIHMLDMSGCTQATITDAAFGHLAGVHTLDMRGCTQATISAECRARLRQAGIPVLHM